MQQPNVSLGIGSDLDCTVDQISEAHEAKNLEKMFRLSKQNMTSKKPKDIPYEGLEDHFQKHFTHVPPSESPPVEITNPPEFIKRLAASGLFPGEEYLQPVSVPPNSQEIISIIKKTKTKNKL